MQPQDTNRRSFLRDAGHLCAGAVAGTAIAATASAADADGGQKFLLIGLMGSENPLAPIFHLPGPRRCGKLAMKFELNWPGTPPCSCELPYPTA